MQRDKLSSLLPSPAPFATKLVIFLTGNIIFSKSHKTIASASSYMVHWYWFNITSSKGMCKESDFSFSAVLLVGYLSSALIRKEQ